MSQVDVPEPDPKPGIIDIVNLVVADIEARAEYGEALYGTRLQAFNKRDALMDAYQEALDLVMYLRQVLAEIDLRGTRT